MFPKEDAVIRWKTLDFHVGGEAVRVFQSGCGEPQGRTMMEKRTWLQQDPLVQCTIREPRGHAGMYAAVLTEPVEEGSRFGVLFACNTFVFPMFCGHAFLGAVCGAVHMGRVGCLAEGENRFPVDVPSGTVEAAVVLENGKIKRVAFVDQPCFALAQDMPVETEGFGVIPVSVAWAGSFMAYVPEKYLGTPIGSEAVPKALEMGHAIEQALKYCAADFRHPLRPELRLKNIGALICFVTDAEMEGNALKAKTLNIIDRNNYDRGAAGTGTCGRLAMLHAQGIPVIGKTLYNYCITGQHYDAFGITEAEVSGRQAVIAELTAKVYEMGESSFCLDGADPFPQGF